MTNLITKPNIAAADEFYQTLLVAHEDLPLAESVAMNARLILVLANHIGDMDVLSQALDVATQPPKIAE